MSYITNESDHKHNKSHVVDDTVLFKVDPITRQIIKVDENDVVLVKNDHNSERYRISMPRYIDGHDMSLCDTARVHYINTGTTSGVASSDVYESDDLGLVIEEGMTAADATEISFTWLVANTATQEHGRLAFAIELCCTGDNTSDGYAWHSGVYADITVSDGIHNGKAIVGVYGDILQSWWEKLFVDMGGVVEENSKNRFRFWLGTQEEYDAIKPEDIILDCVYFIEDEVVVDDLQKRLDEVYPHIYDKANPHGVTAEQVGAYSKGETYNRGEVDSIASTAEDNATAYTEERLGDIGTDNTVKDYADSVAQTAENNAKSYADSVAQTAEANAKSYTDTYIGGHNLLPVSQGEGEYYTPETSGKREFVNTGIDLTPIFDKYGGVSYTISADIKSENVDINAAITIYTQTNSGAYYVFQQSVRVTTEWARYSVTIKPTRNEQYTYDTRSLLAFYGGYDSGNCPHIRNIKIELGSTASDWSPATGGILLTSEGVSKLPWSVPGTDHRVYSQDNADGSEAYIWASSENPNTGYIPIRGENGHIIVPVDPYADNHAASKKYVDDVSKNIDVSFRDSETGQITVPITPTNRAHATSKEYVDSHIASRLLLSSMETPPEPTIENHYNKYYVFYGSLSPTGIYELWVGNIVIPFTLHHIKNPTERVLASVSRVRSPYDDIITGAETTIEHDVYDLLGTYDSTSGVWSLRLRCFSILSGSRFPLSLSENDGIYVYQVGR